VTKQTEVALGEALAALLPHLDEWQRRLALERLPGCWGTGGCAGWRVVRGWRSRRWRAARASWAVRRRTGRGRWCGPKPERLRERNSGLVPALLALVEPDQRGDPESRCAGQ
jgi:hypothetical protein